MGRELFVPADIRHRFRQAAEIIREHVPDIADAEGRGFRNLAGVNDEAPFLQGLVKLLEIKILLRVQEGRDDGGLELVRKQGPEPAPAHSLHQRRMVFPVPGMAGFSLLTLLIFIGEGVRDAFDSRRND